MLLSDFIWTNKKQYFRIIYYINVKFVLVINYLHIKIECSCKL